MRNLDIRIISTQLGLRSESLEAWLAKEQQTKSEQIYKPEMRNQCHGYDPYENKPSDEMSIISL
ncbi:hypothetical protein [Paenibacillus sp. FJAT-26967]|uniref:hypothetical protein n=1 Tax=Paenibacillus sp. FJAT-26967 TaxID=1729690 RepID=UPI000838BC52|nr:hypothetical protein [Paenibacillus sp. FJAT-26967]